MIVIGFRRQRLLDIWRKRRSRKREAFRLITLMLDLRVWIGFGQWFEIWYR